MPPAIESKKIGAKVAKFKTPTSRAECVSDNTTTDAVTFCSQVPMFEVSPPDQ
jgi:hypothetical protein